MKRIVAIMAALGLVVSLAACGSSGSKESKENNKNAAGDKKTIAGIVFQEDQFFNLMTAGYEQAAKDRGYTIQMSNVSNDQAKETEVINTYVAQGLLELQFHLCQRLFHQKHCHQQQKKV